MKRWEQLNYEVELEYSRLADEETSVAEVCPSCKGGSGEEKSFRVSSRGGVLLYYCHRSSCNFRGRLNLHERGGAGGAEATASTKRFRIPATQLDLGTVESLAQRYRIPPETIESLGLRWCGESSGYYSGRLYLPIVRPDLKESGANLRSLQPGVVPKSIIHLYDPESVSSSWVKLQRRSDLLVIVEDQFSAYKIGTYHHSLALLGTNLNESKVDEIAEQPKYKKIVLALDNDATMQAIKLLFKWQRRLPNLEVVGLAKDLKDQTEDELTKFRESIAL